MNVTRSLIGVDGFQKVAICQFQYRYPIPAPAWKYPFRPQYNSLVDLLNVELSRLTDLFPKIGLQVVRFSGNHQSALQASTLVYDNI